MENAPGASAPKPIRRAPAQKAAQEKGLPQDVFLHENAMGGFTDSGRKPKKLNPGVLGDKPKRRRKPLVPAPDGTQRNLDLVPDDEVVVVASMPGPRGIVELDDADEPEAFPLAVKGVEDAARATIAQALYHEVGKPGSLLSHPTGVAFTVRPGLGTGEARSHHRIHVPLPGGNATSHLCDLCIELETGAMLVLDVLTAQSPMSEVKARAFDALQLRGLSQCYAVLVFVHGKGGLERDQVEAVAHGYDHFFGVESDHVSDSAHYTALKARVTQWIKAASKR
ncbi:MAG: hypothetical protein AABY18_04110 [Candidatus Thermoplasmatota archaeon]